ncbi:Coagulation factor 5/8 C-terminal domain [Trinorchestia longiramus]|nr:Coagulation factor 5/8 C-terminal domain [Trinorchestia longiramus]
MNSTAIGTATHIFSCCSEAPINPKTVTRPGLSVRASTVWAAHSGPENAIDGRNSSAYFGKEDELPFLEVDLGEVFTIASVRLLPRKVVYGTGRFKNISVRAGLTQVSGPDFSSYEELALFPGPPPNPWGWLEHRLSEPVNGRYVAIQRIATTGESYLEMNEFEVLVPIC